MPAGIRGLVHISELHKFNEVRKEYAEGDSFDVVVLQSREPGKLNFSR